MWPPAVGQKQAEQKPLHGVQWNIRGLNSPGVSFKVARQAAGNRAIGFRQHRQP